MSKTFLLKHSNIKALSEEGCHRCNFTKLVKCCGHFSGSFPQIFRTVFLRVFLGGYSPKSNLLKSLLKIQLVFHNTITSSWKNIYQKYLLKETLNSNLCIIQKNQVNYKPSPYLHQIFILRKKTLIVYVLMLWCSACS